MPHMRSRILAAVTAAALLLLGLVGVTPAQAAGDPAGVSGAITGPSGAALTGVTGITIRLEEPAEEFWDEVAGVDDITLGPGESNYSFTGVEPGYQHAYRIIVTVQGGSYARTTVSEFVLSPGQSLTHDISLALGATVSGTVTGPDGSAPTGNVHVALEKWQYSDDGVDVEWEQQGDASALAPGGTGFSFSGLSVGDYRLRVIPGSPYVASHSEAFTLTAGESRSGVRMKLAMPASVKVGIVGGQHYSNLWMTVSRQSNGRWDDVLSGSVAARQTSRTLSKLEPGTYRIGIGFCRIRTNHSRTFSLKSGQVRTGVSVTLPSSCEDAPSFLRLTGKTGKGKARISLSIAATGVPTSRIDGRAKISYRGKVLKRATVTDGRATFVLTGQKPGTKLYRVTFTGSANGWVRGIWKPLRLALP